MKVLILSCNTGGGHNAAASALKESLNFYHHEAEVLDLMSLGNWCGRATRSPFISA